MTDPAAIRASRPGRRPDLDQAKGVGILLVIAGHSTPPEVLATAIYGFHMPLFFLISGLLWRDVVRPRASVRALMMPFYVASSLSWVLWVGKQFFYKGDGIPLWGPLAATLYAGDWRGYLVHNAPLWFLPAMFSMLLLIWLAQRVAPPRFAVAGVAFLGLIVVGTSAVNGWWASLPLSMGQGAVGAIFFAAGRLGREIKPPRLNMLIQYALAAVGVIVYLVGSAWQGRVDLHGLNFGDPLVYVFDGLIGSALVLWWSRREWATADRVAMLGRHSLFILVTHLPLLWMVRAVVRPLHTDVSWWMLTGVAALFYSVFFGWREARDRELSLEGLT